MTTPLTPIADRILNIVHAFPDQGRKNSVRDLAASVHAVETERDALAAEVERLRARVGELEESNAMGCEAPPAGCNCAGCGYRRSAES